MAKPKSAPTAQRFELPEAAPLMQPDFDPFTVAKQFDQLRSSMGGGAAPFVMPQPKPITFGGTVPGPAKAAPLPAGHSPGDGHNHGPAPAFDGGAVGSSDWGSKTQAFQQQMGGELRHTSGYRSPEKNAKTPGAAKNSYHMQQDKAGNARANDYAGSPAAMQRGAAIAKQMGAKEVLIHNAGTGMHLHIAW